MLNKDKVFTTDEKDEAEKYKAEIASEIGLDNYDYIYNNAISKGKKSKISKWFLNK